MAALDGIAFSGPVSGRDAGDDVLWQWWRRNRGAGEPLCSEVHGPRQQRAVRQRLCQVCEGPADRNERRSLWLLEYAGKADVFLTGRWSIKWVVGNQLVASLARCTALDPTEGSLTLPASRAQTRR